MTEKFIRDTAAQFKLDVLKRITTGNDKSHFATLELSGSLDAVRAAWPTIKKQSLADGRGTSFDGVRRCDNAEHESCGMPYIECQSIWCEPGQ